VAAHTAVAGERPTAAQWNDWVFKRVVADCTSSTRPASPVDMQPIGETDTDKLLVYEAGAAAWIELGKLGAWTTYTPTWTCSGTAPAIGNGTLSGRYQRLFGRTYLVQIYLLAGSTTTFGTGVWSFATPGGLSTAAAYPVGVGLALLASIWPVTLLASGVTFLPYTATSSTDPRLAAVTVTSPTAWASTHYLAASIVWESAS